KSSSSYANWKSTPMNRRIPPTTAVIVTVLITAIPALSQQAPAPFTAPAEIRFQKQTILSEGTRLAAEVFALKSQEGKKLPTLILCHGWGGTAAALRPEAIVFARAGYLVVTFDYRGWGASEARVILAKPNQEDRGK